MSMQETLKGYGDGLVGWPTVVEAARAADWQPISFGWARDHEEDPNPWPQPDTVQVIEDAEMRNRITPAEADQLQAIAASKL